MAHNSIVVTLSNMKLFARRYDTGQRIALHVEGGLIARSEPLAKRAVGADLPWIAPGLVDVQVNGYAGRELTSSSLTIQDVAEVCRAMDPLGVTSFCATVTTQSEHVLAHALRTIAAACESSPMVASRLVGIHLEGPYVSLRDGPRGAHPAQHCRPPDGDEFGRLQEAAGGRIRILTMSPEWEHAADFVAKVARSGVVVAIGHTAASADQIRGAVDAGARLSTHLGNGCHLQLRRHPNYLWDQLAEDRLMASFIADGHHLPGEVVKTFVRAKTPSRCLLVSDLTAMAAMPPGQYDGTSLGPVEVLADGRLVVAGQRDLLAGASEPIGAGIANVMRFAGVDLKTAVEMATTQPARLIGRTPGTLQAGAAADLIQFDFSGDAPEADPSRLALRATIKAGECVFGRTVPNCPSNDR